jgi:hypothetical protein
LQIVEAFPARLRAAKCFPVELDVEALGGEETFLHGDEIIQPHALGRDPDAVQLPGHAASSDAIFTGGCSCV